MTILRIIPGPKGPDGAHRANGTRVLMPDGTEVPMVRAITLRAEAGGLWQAQIDCAVEVAQEIAALRLDQP